MKPQVILVALFFLASSCDTTDPPILPAPIPYTPTIELSLVDGGLTDAYLRVRFLDSSLVRSFLLIRNEQSILDVSILGQDTVIVDNALQMNTVYEFKAFRTRDSLIVDSSAVVQVTTLDTTSHDYTFQTFYLGEGASSIVNDIAIINDTLIYAVGEISFRDSVGGWQFPPYNVATWNGTSWGFVNTRDSAYPFSLDEIYAIHAISSSDVWVGGTIPEHWNGQQWVFHGGTRGYVGGFRIRGIWGVSSQDLYVVGDDGNIRHFDGTTWSRVESGTALHLYDIFGDRNASTGETEIYAVAGNRFVSSDHLVLKIQGNQVSTVSDVGLPVDLDGIWFKSGRRYIISGNGVFGKSDINSTASWQVLQPSGITEYYDVNGTGLNDMVVSGSYGELKHFNGSTWRSFRDFTSSSSQLYACSIRENIIAAAGHNGSRGYVVIGIRNH